MPEDSKTTQSPLPTENSIPPSPQEPTEPVLENTAHSEPSIALPEALESSPNDFSVKSNDIPSSDSTPSEPEKTQENQASSGAEALADKENEPVSEPVSEPNQDPEPGTPQIPVNEPLPESEPSVSPLPQSTSEASKAKEEPKPIETPEPEPEKEKPRISYIKSQKAKELLVMARNAMQFRKRKKLDRVMSLFLEKSKITNDEVEKFLHVSDATATRYLSQLEKEGKIKQNGKTGHMVSYSRI